MVPTVQVYVYYTTIYNTEIVIGSETVWRRKKDRKFSHPLRPKQKKTPPRRIRVRAISRTLRCG